MTNPFEDNKALYLVVVNAKEQHSLSPAHLDAPRGWHTVVGRATREGMLEWRKGRHFLAFLGLAAALTCYKKLTKLAT